MISCSQDSTGDIWKVAKVFPKVARCFFFLKSLKGSEKSLNLATKSLSWQHWCAHTLGHASSSRPPNASHPSIQKLIGY